MIVHGILGGTGTRRARALLVAIGLGIVGGSGACARCDAPPAPPSPEVSAPPALPGVRDAGIAVTDARGDAADALARPVRHPPARSGARSAGGTGGIKVEGSLPKGEAEKVVRAGMAKVRACNPGLPGRVMIRLEIDDRGHVTLGEVVRSTLASGDSEMCMVRATRDFKFPAAPGGSTVTFPLAFAP
jgi:hypothetical protein